MRLMVSSWVAEFLVRPNSPMNKNLETKVSLWAANTPHFADFLLTSKLARSKFEQGIVV